MPEFSDRDHTLFVETRLTINMSALSATLDWKIALTVERTMTVSSYRNVQQFERNIAIKQSHFPNLNL